MKKEEKQEHNTPNRGVWKNLKSTYKYARKGKKYLFWFLFINLILTVISVVVPVIIAKRMVILTSGLFEKLFGFIILIFIIEIFRNIIRYLYNYVYNKFYYDVRKNLQIELTRETLKLSQDELNHNSSGVFIERINNDTDNLTDIFTTLIDYIISIIGNIGVLISVFLINIYLGLAYILFITIIIIYNKFTSNINYKNRKEWKKNREKTGGFISEIVRGAKDVKILDSEESFLAKASEYMEETNKVSYKYQRSRAKLRMYGGSIRDICDLGISLLMYFLLISNGLTIEEAIIIYNYHNQLTWTADWIEQIYEILKQFNLAANRIFGILEESEFKKEKFGNKKLENFKGNIEFKDVFFSYQDGVPILKGLNLQIKANETIGFVGYSGSGKTTIFNLISALNRKTSGEILLDGISIDELDKSPIRGNLSVISQNAYIFNMSIMDNLRIVKREAADEEIKEACRLAYLDDFIESLPEGYNTIVGEGGVSLSGGQKQRLAIARALLLKTEILLFDEATSALDNQTQMKIQTAIHNLKGEYTILMIAHRLSTVIDCDKIFVIDDGRVQAVGNHKYLLQNSKIYQQLYKKEAEE
mgnify:FL=1